MKTIEFKVQRVIPAPPDEVYDAWLNPEVPGNPWHLADKFLLNPSVDGFFYWTMKGIAHYGRFTALQRPGRVEHTWVSPNTLGYESTVSVRFEKKQGQETLMVLVHSGLPEDEKARSHEKGWNFFLSTFLEHFRKQS